VIRISLSYIYNMAIQLEPLDKLPAEDSSFSSILPSIYPAKIMLDNFETSLFRPYLRTSLGHFVELKRVIDQQIENTDFKRSVSSFELFAIRSAFQQYRTTLQAELAILDSYFVTQKGGYDTMSLLMWGENCFPWDLKEKVPEAVFDVRESTKSLAYELPTAAGFHIFRATESVLRRYHANVTGGSAPPKSRNIGVYLESLRRTQTGDPKVRAALKQMTDLHRNPIIHPEAVLTIEEALSIMGVARGAISAMLSALPPVSPTTSSVTIHQGP
jgi:hypothetical protein